MCFLCAWLMIYEVFVCDPGFDCFKNGSVKSAS